MSKVDGGVSDFGGAGGPNNTYDTQSKEEHSQSISRMNSQLNQLDKESQKRGAQIIVSNEDAEEE